MDTSFYKDVNHFAIHTTWLHGFMKLYATDGVGIFAVLVLAGWWLARYRPMPPGPSPRRGGPPSEPS